MYTGIVHSSYKKAVLVLYTRDVILHYFFSKNSLLLVVNVVYQQALPSVFTIALGGSHGLECVEEYICFLPHLVFFTVSSHHSK